MSHRLEGKQALITGASRGIGKGLAKVFLDEGASLFLCARNPEALEKTARELEANGPVHFQAADLGEPEEAARIAGAAVAALPNLSVVVNNASILGRRSTIEDFDVETWDEVLKINTSSVFYLTKPLIPHLKSRGGASVINVSSTVGRIGKPNWNAYAVSKFGLEGLTQVLAAELEPFGVRVNAVNPGATRTAMRASAYPDEDPMTLPTPEDIAEIFVHLASDESVGTTGKSFEAREHMKQESA